MKITDKIARAMANSEHLRGFNAPWDDLDVETKIKFRILAYVAVKTLDRIRANRGKKR